MSLFKLIVGLLIIGSIVVIIHEQIKIRRAADNKRKVANDLEAELGKVQNDLLRVDVKETVVDAKTTLKRRQDAIAKKEAALTSNQKKAKK